MKATRDAMTGGQAPEARIYALAVSLTVLAGFVDATGYVQFHHLFVSFMSGNSTQAVVAAAVGDGEKLWVVGRTIVLFVAGVIGGELVAASTSRWGRPLVLLIETMLLGAALAGFAWSEAVPASALALAMGVQNAAVHKAEGISVALTYVTGTLVHIGRGVAAALRGAATWRAVLPFLGLWLGLVSGGLLGALAAARSPTMALAIATAASGALLLWALIGALGATALPSRRRPH